MPERSFWNRAAWLLTAVGAVNWGLVGMARFDLVRRLFGRDTFVSRLVYGLVGLSGAWSAYRLTTALTRSPRMVRR